MEKVLSICLGFCYAGATTENKKAAQNVSIAQKISVCPLPPLEALTRSSCLRKTMAIKGDALAPRQPPIGPNAVWLAPRVSQVPHLQTYQQLLPEDHQKHYPLTPQPCPPTSPIWAMVWVTPITQTTHLFLYIFLLIVYISPVSYLFLYFIPSKSVWSTHSFVLHVQWQ